MIVVDLLPLPGGSLFGTYFMALVFSFKKEVADGIEPP